MDPLCRKHPGLGWGDSLPAFFPFLFPGVVAAPKMARNINLLVTTRSPLGEGMDEVLVYN